jgi:hypothetical protein
LLFAELCSWTRSLEYRAVVSVGARWVGVFVVVVADLVPGDSAVGWAMQGPNCLCSFRGAGTIAGHTFEDLGHLQTMVGGAPA